LKKLSSDALQLENFLSSPLMANCPLFPMKGHLHTNRYFQATPDFVFRKQWLPYPREDSVACCPSLPQRRTTKRLKHVIIRGHYEDKNRPLGKIVESGF
jgi:hypothetical protein